MNFPAPLNAPWVHEERRRFTRRMIASYLTFSLLIIIGHVSKPVLGEFADVLMMLAFFWPFGLIVAAPRWVVDADVMFGVLVVAFGFLLVWAFSIKVTRWFPWLLLTRGRVSACSLILWTVPLFLAQLAAILAKLICGHPIDV